MWGAKQAVQRAAVFRSHPWLAEFQQGGGRRRDERIRYFMERDEIVESVGGRDLEEPTRFGHPGLANQMGERGSRRLIGAMGWIPPVAAGQHRRSSRSQNARAFVWSAPASRRSSSMRPSTLW